MGEQTHGGALREKMNDWGARLGAYDRLVSRIIWGVLSLVAALIAWSTYPADMETTKAEGVLAVLCAAGALRPGWKRTMN